MKNAHVGSIQQYVFYCSRTGIRTFLAAEGTFFPGGYFFLLTSELISDFFHGFDARDCPQASRVFSRLGLFKLHPKKDKSEAQNPRDRSSAGRLFSSGRLRFKRIRTPNQSTRKHEERPCSRIISSAPRPKQWSSTPTLPIHPLLFPNPISYRFRFFIGLFFTFLFNCSLCCLCLHFPAGLYLPNAFHASQRVPRGLRPRVPTLLH